MTGQKAKPALALAAVFGLAAGGLLAAGGTAAAGESGGVRETAFACTLKDLRGNPARPDHASELKVKTLLKVAASARTGEDIELRVGFAAESKVKGNLWEPTRELKSLDRVLLEITSSTGRKDVVLVGQGGVQSALDDGYFTIADEFAGKLRLDAGSYQIAVAGYAFDVDDGATKVSSGTCATQTGAEGALVVAAASATPTTTSPSGQRTVVQSIRAGMNGNGTPTASATTATATATSTGTATVTTARSTSKAPTTTPLANTGGGSGIAAFALLAGSLTLGAIAVILALPHRRRRLMET